MKNLEFKGTKGEWKIIGRTNLKITSKIDILDYPICSLDNFDKSVEANKANAKLIAAAPDLLEALQKILDYDLEETYPGFNKDTGIIKAIEKALG